MNTRQLYAYLTGKGVAPTIAKDAAGDFGDDFEGPGNVGVGLRRGKSEGDYARWNSGTVPESDMPSPTGGDRDARGLDGARQVSESSDIAPQIGTQAAYEEGIDVVKAVSDLKADVVELKEVVGDLKEVVGAMSRKGETTPPNFRTMKANVPEIGKTEVAVLAAAVNKLDEELSTSERIAARRLVGQYGIAKSTGDFAGFETSLRNCSNSRVRDVFGAVYKLPEWKLS